MTNVVIWPDVSHWQVPVDDRFTGPFLMYKISEGTGYVDPNASTNSSWCHAHSGPGKKMVGHGGYHVWAPGNEQAQAELFFGHAKVSPYFVAMIDVESWGGRITGDHSASITKLVNLFAARLGQRRVKVYANSGDMAELYPTRPAWLGLHKAKYSSFAPVEPWVGWQYTDGSTNWPKPTSYPRASAPFGNCDHNAFLGTLEQFAAAWGIPITTATPVPVTPTGITPASTTPIHLPPSQKADAMHPRLLVVDKKTVPAGKAWPGDFLQGTGDLSLHHVVDPASFNAYKAAGSETVTITYAEYDAYRREGMIHAPVKA